MASLPLPIQTSFYFIRKYLVVLLRLGCRLTMAPRCKRLPAQGPNFFEAHFFSQGIARNTRSFCRSNECFVQELFFRAYQCHIIHSKQLLFLQED